MSINIANQSLTRRSFLSLGASALGSGLLFSMGPEIALADQARASAPGKRINPYSVNMSGGRTISTISCSYYLYELRKAIFDNAYWLWVRATTYKGSNFSYSETVRLTTPYGTVSDGLIYGDGNGWDIGSQRCSPAICIGVPTTTITVTYTGSSASVLEGDFSKTVQIPAEGIARSMQLI